MKWLIALILAPAAALLLAAVALVPVDKLLPLLAKLFALSSALLVGACGAVPLAAPPQPVGPNGVVVVIPGAATTPNSSFWDGFKTDTK